MIYAQLELFINKPESEFSPRTRVKSTYFDFNTVKNYFRNIKSVLFWNEFHSLTKLSKLTKIWTNQFIFTKSEKI